MGISTREISDVIKERLKDFDATLVSADVGRIVAVGDGIAQIYGLQNAMAGELLEFPRDTYGLALNLEEDQVRSVILGEFGHLHEGDEVRTTGRLLEVPVGDELLGRIVNPLGVPLDDKGPIKTSRTLPVEKIAPGVITRQRVDSPVQTGIKAIDAMIPIGRGQRELIIGDRFTGKTTVLLDTIINQKGKDLYCIYVAIGQNAASIARVAATLEEAGAMDYTIIVAASAADPASLQYIAPYAGCAMGEYFMEQGKEALCCYDALTKAMRQVSGKLRLDLAQYRELAAFAQFASDLDSATRNQLERGARLTELLKQDKYQPVALGQQVAALYAGTQGHLDKVPVARVREWEAGFVRFLKADRPSLLEEIEKQKALDDTLLARLNAAISTYNHQFGVEGYQEQADSAAAAPAASKKAP